MSISLDLLLNIANLHLHTAVHWTTTCANCCKQCRMTRFEVMRSSDELHALSVCRNEAATSSTQTSLKINQAGFETGDLKQA